MKSVCCIVGAGPSPAYVKDGAFVIAADGGLNKLQALGVTPDLILGDFDSLGSRPVGDNILTFPVEKDDTDTMLAIKEALRRGYETLYISGGIGGRLDHTVANLQSLLFAHKCGAEAFLVGENETVAVLADGTVTFSAACQGKISVFAMGERAEGVTIRGLKYETVGVTLAHDFPLGVSNQFMGAEASVTVEKGTILLVWEGCPDELKRDRKG
jgi:thiamine pyrophosphokinase